MHRKDKREKEDFQEIEESFYLEIPEEKIFYPIDLTYTINNGNSLKIKDNLNVDLKEGLRKPVEIVEIDFKKIKKQKKNARK